jgi:hypothetical protein
MKTIVPAIGHGEMEVEDSSTKNVKITLFDASGKKGSPLIFTKADIQRLAKGL